MGIGLALEVVGSCWVIMMGCLIKMQTCFREANPLLMCGVYAGSCTRQTNASGRQMTNKTLARQEAHSAAPQLVGWGWRGPVGRLAAARQWVSAAQPGQLVVHFAAQLGCRPSAQWGWHLQPAARWVTHPAARWHLALPAVWRWLHWGYLQWASGVRSRLPVLMRERGKIFHKVEWPRNDDVDTIVRCCNYLKLLWALVWNRSRTYHWQRSRGLSGQQVQRYWEGRFQKHLRIIYYVGYAICCSQHVFNWLYNVTSEQISQSSRKLFNDCVRHKNKSKFSFYVNESNSEVTGSTWVGQDVQGGYLESPVTLHW